MTQTSVDQRYNRPDDGISTSSSNIQVGRGSESQIVKEDRQIPTTIKGEDRQSSSNNNIIVDELNEDSSMREDPALQSRPR
jgi:hypothetical protein